MTTQARIRFALARVTLEFISGFSIGTGRGDDLYDRVSVVDANGVPALPGTSLAGVLRAAWQDAMQERASRNRPAREPTSTTDLFGFQHGSRGQASRVRVSWGYAHDAHDRPVAGRLRPPSPANPDPVLQALRAGVLRDHVRIGAHGAVHDRGKYDALIVPAGARFTFELTVVDGDPDPKEAMDRLLALLRFGQLAIGGKTRSGIGAFRVTSVRGQVFDLRLAKDREAYLGLSRDLSEPHRLPEWPTPKVDMRRRSMLDLSVRLQPEDGWLFGTGDINRDAFRVKDKEGNLKNADKAPLTEARIVWNQGRGSVEAADKAPLLIAGSSIKGALRHRTLFHLLRLGAQYLEPNVEPPQDSTLDIIFGSIKESKEEGPDGKPGRMFIRDVHVSEAKTMALMHVSLDRFTMGPMDGLLFSEVVATGGAIDLAMHLEVPEQPDVHWLTATRALHAALQDLVEGRLALGAGSNRGHGYFAGTPKHPDQWNQLAGGAT